MNESDLLKLSLSQANDSVGKLLPVFREGIFQEQR